MNKWFYLNILVLIVAIWNGLNSSTLGVHILLGLLGLFLVLFNWTRHAVFSTIRSSRDRSTKIKLANLSKKIMPFHRWIGTASLLIIIMHASLVIFRYGFYWQNFKMVSGLLTGIILIGMVATGWMRLFKPSGRLRRFHLRLGILLFFFIVLHMIF
ncbi:hypothetical protein KFZ58_01710 [Virgibacillus sp. NKC19-16]|uniref:hypothetical protein n=1 Tax=Virgibacillus salidurans TaxID=2831673 RepID=UPI001F3C1938|nr:hypothetical protein [Virgibacillus sp. NKC19-16]UJL46700.1 hypothetical protein KFZ58_01710 [Virgibacillus sp. NKC19-16]